LKFLDYFKELEWRKMRSIEKNKNDEIYLMIDNFKIKPV
jgi:hypothetical protein